MIELRAVEETDLPFFLVWRNDKKLRSYFREYRELTMLDQYRWYESLAGNSLTAMFTIVERQGEATKPVGCCGLTNIDWFNRAAEVSLYIGGTYIDERAMEALVKLVEIAFRDYGLHRLWVEVWAYDAQKIKLLEEYGFAKEGTLRKAHWYNASFHDSVFYGLLNRDRE